MTAKERAELIREIARAIGDVKVETEWNDKLEDYIPNLQWTIDNIFTNLWNLAEETESSDEQGEA